jgi:hypothetical protein
MPPTLKKKSKQNAMTSILEKQRLTHRKVKSLLAGNCKNKFFYK